MEKITAIIVAGGSGKRMGASIKKQYILLNEKEILAYTVEVFEKCRMVDDIIVVVSEEEISYVKENIIDRYQLSKVKKVTAGGRERQDSVYSGLLAADPATNYVMIHDGARPFITEETIVKCLQKAKDTGASIAAVPVKDTIKVCSLNSHKVEKTPDRSTLWSVQTPQVFDFKMLVEAYEYVNEKGLQVTDDSMAAEAFGKEVYIIEGDYTNIKVTTPEDLIIARAIIDQRMGKA